MSCFWKSGSILWHRWIINLDTVGEQSAQPIPRVDVESSWSVGRGAEVDHVRRPRCWCRLRGGASHDRWGEVSGLIMSVGQDTNTVWEEVPLAIGGVRFQDWSCLSVNIPTQSERRCLSVGTLTPSSGRAPLTARGDCSSGGGCVPAHKPLVGWFPTLVVGFFCLFSWPNVDQRFLYYCARISRVWV